MCEALWLIWKQPTTRRRYVVGILKKEEEKYIFKYVDPELQDAIDDKFDFFPGFEDLKKTYEATELFPNISTRLPNRNRPDYLEILNKYDLESDASNWEILNKTKGRLLTDNYEFVPEFKEDKSDFDIAGTQYATDIKKYENIAAIDDDLQLELEPENENDKNAIKILYIKNKQKFVLGYVPRYYSKYMAELLRKGIQYSAKVKSLKFNSKLSDEYISVTVKLIFKI